jgi:hypothetical protein
MSKHSPAPWHWFTHLNNGVEEKRPSAEPHCKFLVAANGQGFAHTVGLNAEEDEANANLMESAPLLLEALKAFVAEARSRHDFHHGSWTVACDGICALLPQMEAAIAAAEPK